MATTSKKRKAGSEKVASIAKKPKQDPSTNDNDTTTVSSAVMQGGMIGGLVYEDELETTTDTLLLLAKNPSLIGFKTLKPFKTAVHDYWRVAHETTNTGNSLTSRISSALVDQRHIDALVLLAEMVIREQVPKLGALQRWVRECDAVLSPKMSPEEENRVWQVLDAILRTTQPEMIGEANDESRTVKPGSRLRWYTPFTVHPGLATNQTTVTLLNSAEISAAASAILKPLQTTPGSERRPPNKHPVVIYFSPPNTFPLLPKAERTRQPTRHELPGVPGAFIINDALEVAECESLTVHGGAVKGINSRFRLYRYRPGALYRPHIDGAWPSSALNSTTTPPSYIYDSDPTVYSRLTFLIYLNDDFEGGCILEARPVKPRTGTVCVFPHGPQRKLGSGVLSGAKYVIRTEVLYEVDKSERIDASKD
ncbi:hypothetical protein BDZ97DRAFT_1826426 [Flammula alnicola]|nr:hypothetical protein BDZ97DRAFT_1826426 [Flammula alnicola]